LLEKKIGVLSFVELQLGGANYILRRGAKAREDIFYCQDSLKPEFPCQANVSRAERSCPFHPLKANIFIKRTQMKTFDSADLDEKNGETRILKPLKFLKPQQITLLDEALSTLGDFGELHLVVVKGNLRFIVVQKSYDANKLQLEEE
jgi:hypothetical protein